jgi:hypothetical protein
MLRLEQRSLNHSLQLRAEVVTLKNGTTEMEEDGNELFEDSVEDLRQVLLAVNVAFQT